MYRKFHSRKEKMEKIFSLNGDRYINDFKILQRSIRSNKQNKYFIVRIKKIISFRSTHLIKFLATPRKRNSYLNPVIGKALPLVVVHVFPSFTDFFFVSFVRFNTRPLIAFYSSDF